MSRLVLFSKAAFIVWSVLRCSNMSSSSYCMGGARSLRGFFKRVLEEVGGRCVCVVDTVVRVVQACGLLCSWIGGSAVVVSLSFVVVCDCVGCSVVVSVQLCAFCVQKVSSSLVNIVVGRWEASVLSLCCWCVSCSLSVWQLSCGSYVVCSVASW